MTTLLPPPEDEAGKRAWAKRLLEGRERLIHALGGEGILQNAARMLGPKEEAKLRRWLEARAKQGP